MNRWATSHEDALRTLLEPGEELRGAERVILGARDRRKQRNLPRSGFVLVVTDERVIAAEASFWLARPGLVIASWRYDEGAKLAPAGVWLWGRLRLLLPDRSVITLRPYGLRAIAHLAKA